LPLNWNSSKVIFDLASKEKRLQDIEKIIADEKFWDVPEATTSILKERTLISGIIETCKGLALEIEESQLLFDMAMEESDEESIEEVSRQLQSTEKRLDILSLEYMLDGPDDSNDAIISINAGAGGTEAQDWAEMLFRMYMRWMERRGFKGRIIDYQPGEEAGIKGVTITVAGKFAYGYLKTETGVHRLVRISPFNASGKRHTSFASVFVCPELDNTIVVEVDDKDIRLDVFRASGAGGQHVNKTSSAVRISHLPTGIVVQCQQEKSQHRNKEMAMKVLKARLYQLEKEKQDEKLKDLHDGKDNISWGNQIRSYVLHPYQMAKDHRTNMEIGNVNRVLDGDIDSFIEGALLLQSKKAK
jgi:peptide chain release factor 2